MFPAIIPFAVLGGPWAESTSWSLLGAVISVYTAAGLLYFPRAAFRLRRDYPDSFQLPPAVLLTVNDVCRLLLALTVLFAPTGYQANAYVMVLVLFLLQGAIAFVRVLFQRSD